LLLLLLQLLLAAPQRQRLWGSMVPNSPATTEDHRWPDCQWRSNTSSKRVSIATTTVTTAPAVHWIGTAMLSSSGCLQGMKSHLVYRGANVACIAHHCCQLGPLQQLRADLALPARPRWLEEAHPLTVAGKPRLHDFGGTRMAAYLREERPPVLTGPWDYANNCTLAERMLLVRLATCMVLRLLVGAISWRL